MTRDDIIRMYEKANGWSPKGWDKTVDELERFANLVKARLAQPEPEPAWIELTTNEGNKFILDPVKEFDRVQSAKNAGLSLVPLYTAPPKKEWVGLTDEEIKHAWSQLWYDLNNGKFAATDDPSRYTNVMFARALEAELKEKNEY